MDATVPELDSIVPSAGDERVRVARVKDASKHAVVVSVHAIKIATTKRTHGIVDPFSTSTSVYLTHLQLNS